MSRSLAVPLSFRIPFRLLPVVLLIGQLLSATLFAQGEQRLRSFSHSPSSDTVVLEVEREIHMLAERDEQPFLRLYGDGRLLVHYPEMMKKAGDWQRTLSPSEMDRVLSSLLEAGFVESDSQGIAAEVEAMTRQRAAQQRLSLRASAEASPVDVLPAIWISDDETTRVRLRLDSYRASDMDRTRTRVDHTIELRNHKTVSAHFSSLERLTTLSRAFLALEALAENPTMTRVRATAREETIPGGEP